MTTEEDIIEQANITRHERLQALRAAKELSSMPDEDPAHNGNKAEDSVPKYGEKTAAEEDSIEQAAAERRERLKSLRMANELLSTADEITLQSGNNIEDPEETEDDKRLKVKFRNYLPHDKQLQEGKLTPAVITKFEDPVSAAAAPQPVERIEDPFVNIAPKKPNWDLKMDVQKRLDKLERRTTKALYLIMLEEREKEATQAENCVIED